MSALTDLALSAGGPADPVSLPVWLGLGLALGLVHAFDADHVMAVSVFATDERAAGRSAHGRRVGLRWAVGHGGVLLASGLCLIGLGLALPEVWTGVAERIVGIVMVALGARVVFDLLRRRRREGLHLHFHVHDGLPPHAHWHVHASDAPHPPPERHHHAHAPTLLGALHGLAGSAPILALLPVAAQSFASGVAYLVVFGVGVAVGMMLVGGAFARLAEGLGRRGPGRAVEGLRAVSGLGSIAIGVWLGLGV